MSDHPICHVEIPTSDPAALSAFYAAVFEWPLPADPVSNQQFFQPQRGPGGAFVNVDDATGAQTGQVLIYISTDDIDVTLAAAEAHGATTLTPQTEGPFGSSAVFADPAGNRIAL